MRIGISGDTVNSGTIDDVVADVRAAADDGFAGYWASQIFGLDTLTTLAIAGREVTGIEVGTAVIPTYSRHPWALAQQALTTQAAVHGRLSLGIGLSHRVVVEDMWGLSYDRPLRHLREYLDVLVPLSKGEAVASRGETISAAGTLNVRGGMPFPILVAALGPSMLELAGSRTDGTITWCTGPATLATLTVPTITTAAKRAGRAQPRVVAILPVTVTDDVAAARRRAATLFAVYNQLPSYRAMLDREGATDVGDIAIVGSASAVSDRIAALADVGVTDFVAADFSDGDDGRAATRAALREVAATVA